MANRPTKCDWLVLDQMRLVLQFGRVFGSSFLGHRFLGTCPPLQEKTEAVAKWERPSTIKGLQSFLGTANYYRKFVQNYSEITAPMHEMEKKCNAAKTTKLGEWTTLEKNAFEAVKKALVAAPAGGCASFEAF
jgi:hypothetical protein